MLEARDEQAERLAAALARLAAAAPDPAAAVGFARRRLALDPLDEEAARDLMDRQVQAGDRAGALTTYNRVADRLRTNLGLAASAETRALAASVRAAEPSAPISSTLTRDPPLVGRAAEQARLLAVWARTREGAGAIVLLSGEGGIGKTRLAIDLLAHADTARTARATAVDLGGGAPLFGPWAELFAGLARQLDPPPAGAEWPEELGRLAPSLPRRLGRASATPSDVPPDLARARLFEAAVELAEHATQDRPLVLLIDDVHLADAPTLELAAYLARRIRDLPVLLVLTRRTVPRRDAVDALVHAAKATGVVTTEIELEPLERADVERLVGSLGALERERVIAAADGNPLLALESARAAARGDTGPPASLRGAVRAAIATLDEAATRTAELAAVAGRDLDRTELAALADPETVLHASDCGLFLSADGRFGFRHALLREAVYASLDDARRRARHETLGHALTNAAESAHHLKRAGRDDLAAGRLVQAAADATRVTAIHEAAAYLREAVALDPAPNIRLELAATLALLGDRDASLAEFELALPHSASSYLRAAQWFHSSLCDPTGALQATRRGLAAPGGDLDTRVELLLIRAWSEVATIGADAAYRTLAEVEALGVDLVSDPMRRHHVENLRGFIALAEGRLDEAESELVASGEAGERAGRPDLAYGGWANAACVAAVAGDHERALAHADRSATLVSGLPVVEFQVAGLRASALARLGRHAEARASADRQAELAARLASPRLAAMAEHDAGLLALQAGDDERAQALLGRALAGDPPVQRGDARLRRAEALARLGRADEADQEIRAATLEPVRAADRPAVLLARMTFAQGLAARARGNHELAERRLRESERHWHRLDADASGEFLASLVDLGRPPVTGVVDPQYELDRIAAELEAHAHVR